MSDLFLLNLEKIFIFIRNDIKRKENRDIVLFLLNVINNLGCDNDELSIINTKFEIISEIFVLHKIGREEKKTDRIIYKDFLVNSLNYLLSTMDSAEYEKAYDIIDILHAFPNVIIINKRNSKKIFYRIYIKKFCKKWKDNFFKKVFFPI